MEENHLLWGLYTKMIHLWPRDIFFYWGPYTDKEVALLYNFDFSSTPFFRKYIFFQSRMCFCSKSKEQFLNTNMEKSRATGSVVSKQVGKDVSFDCHGSNLGSPICHFSPFLPHEGTPPSTKRPSFFFILCKNFEVFPRRRNSSPGKPPRILKA